ncbi:hypothetical protein [Roseobacter sp.]|uniref:hypothetical protein n=1 Tax=Roseobacter sp. TaxID=1907202 RepID=UPI0025F78E40|nr:hypothetical protein [Roseobacter sp.]
MSLASMAGRLSTQQRCGIVPGMKDRSAHLERRYASAAPVWSDKMRLPGYFNAYLDSLSHMSPALDRPARVIDIGAGTGAMAEAWTAISGLPGNGAARSVTPDA